MAKVKKQKKIDPYDAAVALLSEFDEIQQQIEEFRKKNGIPKLEARADEIKREVTTWAAANDVDRIELPNGRWGTLIRSVAGVVWIWGEEDTPDEFDAPEGFRALRTILRKKFRQDPETLKRVTRQVTRRVVNPEGLDEVVQEGLLTEDEIAPAMVEKMKAPYIRVFGERNE